MINPTGKDAVGHFFRLWCNDSFCVEVVAWREPGMRDYTGVWHPYHPYHPDGSRVDCWDEKDFHPRFTVVED